MMFSPTHKSLYRWTVALLLAVSFVLPNIHVAHAADMEMQDMSSMRAATCLDGECGMPQAQRECLELCFQMSVSDRSVEAVIVLSVTTVSMQEADDQVILPNDESVIVQITGPPKTLARHLTTQKRE